MGVLIKTASRIVRALQAVLQLRRQTLTGSRHADNDDETPNEPDYVIITSLADLLSEYVEIPEATTTSTPARPSSRRSLTWEPRLSPIKEVDSPAHHLQHRSALHSPARARPSMPLLRSTGSAMTGHSYFGKPDASDIFTPRMPPVRSFSTPCLLSLSWLDPDWEERVKAPCFDGDQMGQRGLDVDEGMRMRG